MFPSEQSLIQTCTKFNDPVPLHSKTGMPKKRDSMPRAQSGDVMAMNKPRNIKKTKKPITSEQKSKPLIAPSPDRYNYEIKEEEVEDDMTKDQIATIKEKPSVRDKENLDYNKASLGMGYFFGEGEVPKELEDLLLKYQNFTHELEESHMDDSGYNPAEDSKNEPEAKNVNNKKDTQIKKMKNEPEELEVVEDAPEYKDDFEADFEPETKKLQDHASKKETKKEPSKADLKPIEEGNENTDHITEEKLSENVKEEQPVEEEEEIFAEHHDENYVEEAEMDPEELAKADEEEILPSQPQAAEEVAAPPPEITPKVAPQPSTPGAIMPIEKLAQPDVSKPVNKKQDKCASSYDSATLDSAIGMLDLKLLCRCLAYAIHKHIVFSQGHTLLSDLNNAPTPAAKEPQNFAYNLNDMLKINIPTKIEGNAYDIKETPWKSKSVTTKDSKSKSEKSDEEEKKDKVEELVPEKLAPEKYKQLISESFSALTGQYVPPELLNSYLTVENDEDIDLSYTQTHLDEFIKSCIFSCLTMKSARKW